MKEDGLREAESDFGVLRCLSHGFEHKHVPEACLELTEPLAAKAFLLGLVSIWWNPCLSTKWTRPGGKLVGLGEYYKLQTFLTLIKAAAIYALWTGSSLRIDLGTAKMAHAVILALTIVVSVFIIRLLCAC